MSDIEQELLRAQMASAAIAQKEATAPSMSAHEVEIIASTVLAKMFPRMLMTYLPERLKELCENVDGGYRKIAQLDAGGIAHWADIDAGVGGGGAGGGLVRAASGAGAGARARVGGAGPGQTARGGTQRCPEARISLINPRR